jgi:hypothetical protein
MILSRGWSLEAMPHNVNRRRFLQLTAAAATSAKLFAQKTAAGSLSVRPVSLGVMPLDFTGLSYESSQLADPGFFSPANSELIALFRSLSPNGVLRIGGNLSAFTVWRDDPSMPVTAEQQSILDRGKKYWEWRLSSPAVAHGSHEAILSPKSIQPLAAFLKITGWKLIYGLNFALGTPEQAAAEAACVQQLTGTSLLAFQLGNEDDFWKGGFRSQDWDFNHYYAQWSEWTQKIRIKAPKAPFAGPDTAVNLDWVQRLAQKKKGDIAFLSKHHYAMGPAGSPSATSARLLGPDDDLDKEIATAQQAKERSGVNFRNTECNSCYHGGQPGVSDAYASALWCADFMLRLAKGGHAGVHLHGGGDGTYTPIAGDAQTGTLTPRPLFYGMKFAQAFAGSTLLDTDFKAGGANVTAFCGQRSGELLVALINKDFAPIQVHIDRKSIGGANLHSVEQLTGPSLDALAGTTLEHQKIDPGELARRLSEGLTVPPYTAHLLRFSA